MAADLHAERSMLIAVQDVGKIGSWSFEVASRDPRMDGADAPNLRDRPATLKPTAESVRAIIHPDDRAAVMAAAARILSQPASVHSIEHRLRRPDGAERTVEQRLHVTFDDQGTPLRAVGTCQDITERRRGERALRESQAMLSMAGRLAQVGAWSVELPALRVIWSDTLADIHEMPRGFVPTVEEALAFYAPEHVETMRTSFARCVDDGTPFDVEHAIVTASGRRVWVRAIGEAVRDDNGSVRRVQGALQDLTERKQAEQHMHRLALRLTNTLESISDGFFTVDRNWRYTYVNGRARKQLQERGEELIGREMWEVFPEALGTPFEQGYRRAMSGSTGVAFEAMYAPWNAWISVDCYPTDEGLSVYFRDVTQKRGDTPTPRAARGVRVAAERHRDDPRPGTAHRLRQRRVHPDHRFLAAKKLSADRDMCTAR